MQLELDRGDNKASSLINTTTTSATRSADSRAYTTAVGSFPYNKGAISIDFMVDYDGDNFDTLFSYSTDSVSNGIYARLNQSTGNLEPVVFDSGSQVSGMSEGTPTSLQRYIYGLSFETNNFKGSLNAVDINTDSSGTIPTGLTYFILGGATISGGVSNQRPFNGWIRSVTVYNNSLSDSELLYASSQ